MKRIGIIVAALACLYLLASAGLYTAMRQSPERFGAIMARVPGPVMMVLPFRPLWASARAGALSVGDLAPDFSLQTTDRATTIRLSEQFRDRPVVLIFGSYT